jgi:hypothetical protein
MTFSDAGAAASVKLEGGTTLRGVAEVVLCPPAVTVKLPLAAPDGITIVMLASLELATGAAMVPPSWLASVT